MSIIADSNVKLRYDQKKSRIYIVQSLYAIKYFEHDQISDISSSLKEMEEIFYSHDHDEQDFTKEINQLINIVMLEEQINSTIQNHLSTKWHINRLPIVILSILKAAVYEIISSSLSQQDRAILIADYLEIAKIFNHYQELGFINAILDNIIKDSIASNSIT